MFGGFQSVVLTVSSGSYRVGILSCAPLQQGDGENSLYAQVTHTLPVCELVPQFPLTV